MGTWIIRAKLPRYSSPVLSGKKELHCFDLWKARISPQYLSGCSHSFCTDLSSRWGNLTTRVAGAFSLSLLNLKKEQSRWHLSSSCVYPFERFQRICSSHIIGQQKVEARTRRFFCDKSKLLYRKCHYWRLWVVLYTAFFSSLFMQSNRLGWESFAITLDRNF